MSEIIQFPAKKQKPQVSDLAVATYCIEGLLDDWELKSRKNLLNEYFVTSLSNFIDQKTKKQVIADLNFLSTLQQNLGMAFTVSSWDANVPPGWMVHFKVGDSTWVETPPMTSETNARAFAILAFVLISHELKLLHST